MGRRDDSHVGCLWKTSIASGGNTSGCVNGGGCVRNAHRVSSEIACGFCDFVMSTIQKAGWVDFVRKLVWCVSIIWRSRWWCDWKSFIFLRNPFSSKDRIDCFWVDVLRLCSALLKLVAAREMKRLVLEKLHHEGHFSFDLAVNYVPVTSQPLGTNYLNFTAECRQVKCFVFIATVDWFSTCELTELWHCSLWQKSCTW